MDQTTYNMHELQASIRSLVITKGNIEKRAMLNGPCGTVAKQWDAHTDKTKPMIALIYVARKLAPDGI